MTDTVITVDSLSKSYKIGLKERHGKTFREAFTDTLLSPFRRLNDLRVSASPRPRVDDTFWALKDVSFEVKRGEVVGIIGRNGAGKSTLLKILSRITEPTKGEVRLRGRVASLLEVGTGFHPELTGRENIYLNGAILGMKRAEITRKFDEIVAFAETEKFLDTPVKRYSSGMYVRLAFAVAAHLEPEILIVDEVLSVGDAEFQKKCLGKMQEVSRGGGRTVLFVSHNMGTVRELCTRAILLRGGVLVKDGMADVAVTEYLTQLTKGAATAFVENVERSGSGAIRLTAARVVANGVTTTDLVAGDDIVLEFTYWNPARVDRIDVSLTVFNDRGIPVANMSTSLAHGPFCSLGGGGRFCCALPRLPMTLGGYRVAVCVTANGILADLMPNALVFHVVGSAFYRSGRAPDPNYSVVMLDHTWSHETASEGLA